MAITIRAQHLWQGKSTDTGASVLTIEGERIRSVGQDDPRLPAESVLDFGEATILPGLVDMHTHFRINHQTGDICEQMREAAVPHILAGIRNLQIDMESGVTTAKLNGDRDFYDVQVRDAIRNGLADGPRLVASGRGIKSSRCTGGVVATCIIDDPEAIGRCVDENLAAGADWIKIFSSGRVFGPLADVLEPFYGVAHISVAAAKARAAGKPLSSHCFGGEAADACIRARVNVIDHGWLLSEWQLEAMAKHGIWLCPTIGVLTHPDGVLQHLPHGPARDEARRRIDDICDVLRRAIRMDVPLLIGTDARHGGVAYEMHMLQDLGAPPTMVLRAATSNAAQALGLEDIGVMQEGAMADLIVVRGNAVEDVSRVSDVLLVVHAGRIVRQGMDVAS